MNIQVADLTAIALAAVGARRSSVLDDPVTAPGTLSYIFGTRAMRKTLAPRGYERRRENGIESVYNPTLGIRIAFQNADRAGDPMYDPISTSDKGDASARLVASGQGELFPSIREAEVREAAAPVYYLFTHWTGSEARIELSFPAAVQNGVFVGFNERIIVVEPGAWERWAIVPDDEPGPEFDVEFSRKV